MSKEAKKYVLYTYLSTWTLWGSIIIANQFKLLPWGAPLTMSIFIAGGMMPTVCSIYVKKKYYTKEEFSRFISSTVNPKLHPKRYLFIFGLALTYLFLLMIFGGADMKRPLYTAIIMLPIMIIGGGLEEIGWRGFLQETLQKRFTMFISTLIVGSIWTFWHLPLWFISGSNQANVNFFKYGITVITLSFLLTVVYAITNSIFLCIIFHALINSLWGVFEPNLKLVPICITLIFSIMFFVLFKYIQKNNIHPYKGEKV